MTDTWEASFSRSGAQKAANSMEVDELAAADNITGAQASTKPGKELNQKETNKIAKAIEVKRGLRRKLDNEDLMMRKMKLEAFDEFKESVLFRDDFQEITSHA